MHALRISSSCALQEGRYTAGVQTQTTQNLTGYTVFPFTALQFYNNMNPLLGTCFANTTGLTVTPAMMQRVNDCTEINTICCYTANDQVSPVPCQGILHKPTQLPCFMHEQENPSFADVICMLCIVLKLA